MNLNYKVVLKITGVLMAITGISMFPCFIAACLYRESPMVPVFLLCSLIITLIGTVLIITTKPVSISLRFREGYFVVALGWILVSAIGAIPYLSLVDNNFNDAFFEAVSGFTTTGCTLVSIDLFPKSLMLWKAITHWLGGMGILVFVISILPALGAGAQKIFTAETPGPKLEKVRTKFADSAKTLYIIYFTFTITEFLLLLAGPMNLYDALINTLGCISTGGLFTHSEGFSYYNSFYVEFVISFFTILAAISFTQYDLLIKGKFREFILNRELRAFAGILLVCGLVVSANLFLCDICSSPIQAMRYGFSQVTGFLTTSGYVITNFDNWPSLTKMILFSLMFVGGCAASTCGSVKVIRIMVLFKLISRGIYRRIHPKSVVAVKIGDEPLPAEMVSQITGFLLTYMAIFLAGSCLLSLDNLDLETTMSAVASALSNTGIGFGSLGSSANFHMFSGFARFFLAILMIVGRLELFTVIILFSPAFWSKKQ
ncbi:MAG: TrkH family potassium uptake protein [Clostridia bacterium]|nr:TrkH family potassium uptake protein [Clostridia bacterium]